MTNKPAAFRSPFADVAPALAVYTDDVLFGDVWKRPGLSPRDRSLITVASLVALYRTNHPPRLLRRPACGQHGGRDRSQSHRGDRRLSFRRLCKRKEIEDADSQTWR